MLTEPIHDAAKRSGKPSARYDVLIAGAGPAGLFAALSLAAAGARRVLLIDAGPDIRARRRPPARTPSDKRARPDYESGVGGAGLFSDGKLCLSLSVGGHLETALNDVDRADLERDIEAVLLGLVDGPVQQSEAGPAVKTAAAAAARAGLGFKYYRVAHIGTDRCTGVVVRLRALIEAAGVVIRPRCELIALDEDRPGVLRATLRTAGGQEEITARSVILALGKVGAPRQAELCGRLGIELSGQKLYAGVRLEAPAAAVEPLFALTKDPKYNLILGDGTKIKTHCATQNGEVLTLRYGGLPLAGGHNNSGGRSTCSGFSILWDGLDPGDDAYATALAIMRASAVRTGDALMVQTFADLWRHEPSTVRSLATIHRTCSDAVPGDMRAVLPPEYFRRMEAFVSRLETLAPGLSASDCVVYGPAIEWWMKRVTVNGPLMTTSIPGLSVCGDGSGWSQGIVHAAATGLLAARGIHGRSLRLQDWPGLGRQLAPQRRRQVQAERTGTRAGVSG